MFAVIRTGGKQYKVTPGQVITVEKIAHLTPEVSFEEVLLLGGAGVTVGKPLVAGAKVTAEVFSEGRGEKIKVFKYKAKSHWAKTRGHRQVLTQVKIKDILTGEKAPKRAKREAK